MTNEQWHLSKSVPISIIGAVIVQTVTIVWFIAELNANVQMNTRDLVRHEARIETLEVSAQAQAISVARMDENIQAIRDMVEQLMRQP
jgi:hypothetical protein